MADSTRFHRNPSVPSREPHAGATCLKHQPRPETSCSCQAWLWVFPIEPVQSRALESKTPGSRSCFHRNPVWVILNMLRNLFKLQFFDPKRATASPAALSGRAREARWERRAPLGAGRRKGPRGTAHPALQQPSLKHLFVAKDVEQRDTGPLACPSSETAAFSKDT